MSRGHNGQKKNKLHTLHMCVIKIGFLNFKKPEHSISGKKILLIIAQTFLTPCCSFPYAIKRHKNKLFSYIQLNNFHIKEYQMLKPISFQ